MPHLTCARCGREGDQLAKPPLRNELGERIHATICSACWGEWLKYQTALINHYGLDVRDKPAKEILTGNMEAYLFKSGKTEDIDTTQQGKVSW